MLLTDGEIDDMSETLKIIVKLSKRPCSIIIVGMGNATFTSLNKLNRNIKDNDGNRSSRQHVQFVPYKLITDQTVKNT